MEKTWTWVWWSEDAFLLHNWQKYKFCSSTSSIIWSWSTIVLFCKTMIQRIRANPPELLKRYKMSFLEKSSLWQNIKWAIHAWKPFSEAEIKAILQSRAMWNTDLTVSYVRRLVAIVAAKGGTVVLEVLEFAVTFSTWDVFSCNHLLLLHFVKGPEATCGKCVKVKEIRTGHFFFCNTV